MSKYTITTNPVLCAGCRRCQLACSWLHEKSFAPSRARIRIEVDGPNCSITFAEECDGCGVCADECFYGALVKRGEGAA